MKSSDNIFQSEYKDGHNMTSKTEQKGKNTSQNQIKDFIAADFTKLQSIRHKLTHICMLRSVSKASLVIP